MIGYDGEYPNAWRSIWRTARKQHTCCACREVIDAGHRYRYSSGIWDGEPSSFKHCVRCWRLFEALCDRADEPVDIGLSCGHTWEEIFASAPPEDIVELAFLTPDEGQELEW